MIRKLIVSMVFVAATALMSMAAPPSWEHVQAPPVQIVEIVTPESATEVVVAEGYVYVYVSRPTSVKLISLLGQPIASETLQPGFHRLKLAARGIYILRAGSITRRITL